MHELQYKPEVAARKISTQSAVSHHLYTKSPSNMGAMPGTETLVIKLARPFYIFRDQLSTYLSIWAVSFDPISYALDIDTDRMLNTNLRYYAYD